MYKSLDFSINELKYEIDKLEKIKTIFPECVAEGGSFLLPTKYLSEQELIKVVSNNSYYIEFDFHPDIKKEVMYIKYLNSVRKRICKDTVVPFGLMGDVLAINQSTKKHSNNTFLINEKLDYNWIVFIQKNNKILFENILEYFEKYNVSLNDKFKKVMMLL